MLWKIFDSEENNLPDKKTPIVVRPRKETLSTPVREKAPSDGREPRKIFVKSHMLVVGLTILAQFADQGAATGDQARPQEREGGGRDHAHAGCTGSSNV